MKKDLSILRSHSEAACKLFTIALTLWLAACGLSENAALGKIEGKVINWADQQPMRSAEINATASSNIKELQKYLHLHATTDKQGIFTVSGAHPELEYQILIQKDGYTEARQSSGAQAGRTILIGDTVLCPKPVKPGLWYYDEGELKNALELPERIPVTTLPEQGGQNALGRYSSFAIAEADVSKSSYVPTQGIVAFFASGPIAGAQYLWVYKPGDHTYRLGDIPDGKVVGAFSPESKGQIVNAIEALTRELDPSGRANDGFMAFKLAMQPGEQLFVSDKWERGNTDRIVGGEIVPKSGMVLLAMARGPELDKMSAALSARIKTNVENRTARIEIVKGRGRIRRDGENDREKAIDSYFEDIFLNKLDDSVEIIAVSINPLTVGEGAYEASEATATNLERDQVFLLMGEFTRDSDSTADDLRALLADCGAHATLDIYREAKTKGEQFSISGSLRLTKTADGWLINR